VFIFQEADAIAAAAALAQSRADAELRAAAAAAAQLEADRRAQIALALKQKTDRVNAVRDSALAAAKSRQAAAQRQRAEQRAEADRYRARLVQQQQQSEREKISASGETSLQQRQHVSMSRPPPQQQSADALNGVSLPLFGHAAAASGTQLRTEPALPSSSTSSFAFAAHSLLDTWRSFSDSVPSKPSSASSSFSSSSTNISVPTPPPSAEENLTPLTDDFLVMSGLISDQTQSGINDDTHMPDGTGNGASGDNAVGMDGNDASEQAPTKQQQQQQQQAAAVSSSHSRTLLEIKLEQLTRVDRTAFAHFPALRSLVLDGNRLRYLSVRSVCDSVSMSVPLSVSV
jgi:hypothetical protein